MTPLRELLDAIDPCQLDYQGWCIVGMILKQEGESPDLYDLWSQRDPARYHPGECHKKWQSFNGSAHPVTAGTLVEMARQQGYKLKPEDKYHLPAYTWDQVVPKGDDLRVVDHDWLEETEVVAPSDWQPIDELITYLSTLFQGEEYVGYVMQAWQKDDRWLPQKGNFGRTANELIADLTKYRDIGKALGDHNLEAGAWIRFNPLDGQGVADANVTSFRYALVESDTLSIEKQQAIYTQLELPVAALVHSGKKSLHAIVRIDAANLAEYKERVNFLHQVCKQNGLEIDTQNKNPSRLSRMPGIMRGGEKQYLVGVTQGKASWGEWKDWIEEVNDSLPDFEPLDSVWGSLPALAPPLIDGILRQGHKMLLAGPSKAGKSFMLLQLVIAIAEGREWIGWPCAQGRVLYVNLELDRASCFQRLKWLYDAKGWEPRNLANIDVWNLRGKAVPMDVLAPKLIRRAMKRGYAAVVIDPIYKVITGDENAADKMAFFCNQFDRVCSELGSAVVYCHHHSKGAQGQKTARDRASGSGVFARDPDAMLDLIELTVTDATSKVIENRMACEAIGGVLDRLEPDWSEKIGPDEAIVANVFEPLARARLADVGPLDAALAGVARAMESISGWRMEGTLREFPPLRPVRLWFKYPIHLADVDGILTDAKADGEEPPWAKDKKEGPSKKESQRAAISSAYQALTFGGDPCMVGDLAEHMGVSVATCRKRLNQYKGYVVDGDRVFSAGDHRVWLVRQAAEAIRDVDGRMHISRIAAELGTDDRGVRRWIEGSDLKIENGYLEGV